MAILDEIERDIRAFADPGTAVLVDSASAIWERDGKQFHATFTASGQQNYPDVTIIDTRIPYREFLASEYMADLRTFAEFIVKTTARPNAYIETDATLDDDSEADESLVGPATEIVRARSTENLPFLSTRVVLVRGEAGSGKTIALREATARRAQSYINGDSDSLFFYVDAQGRALSRLEDAMAKDLQDLRSKFSYAAVAPLTRHRLLVPIIDGFDELLGSGGYDEAFASLAALLATLDGQGSVVASARSAFFDYRNFYDNATRFSNDGRLNYVVDTVSVAPWAEEQVREYFFEYGERVPGGGERMLSSLDEMIAAMSPDNKELLGKPFYASKIAQLLSEEEEFRADEDLLDQLVDAFVDREHRKLLDKFNKPLLSKKGHHAFLAGLAEEMWWQEDRRLDVGTVQAVAELITEAFGLPPTAAHAIVERVSSYAFLTSDESAKRFLRFEHEVFYGYFLAHKLREYIEREPTDLRRFLSRAVAEPTVIEQTVRLLGTDIDRCSDAIESLSQVLRPNLSEVVARENAGMMIAAIARSATRIRPSIVMRHVIFRQIKLGPLAAVSPTFERCDFTDVDFTAVRFQTPRFITCALRNSIVDVESTKFEGAEAELLDQVHGLTVRGENDDLPAGRIFAPHDVSRVLSYLGVTVPTGTEGRRYSKKVQRRVSVLDRFLRKMERRFYVSDEDMSHFPFSREREWSEVIKLLDECQLIERQFIDKSGPREALMRLRVPPEILRRGEDLSDPSAPAQVIEFWGRLLEVSLPDSEK